MHMYCFNKLLNNVIIIITIKSNCKNTFTFPTTIVVTITIRTMHNISMNMAKPANRA